MVKNPDGSITQHYSMPPQYQAMPQAMPPTPPSPAAPAALAAVAVPATAGAPVVQAQAKAASVPAVPVVPSATNPAPTQVWRPVETPKEKVKAKTEKRYRIVRSKTTRERKRGEEEKSGEEERGKYPSWMSERVREVCEKYLFSGKFVQEMEEWSLQDLKWYLASNGRLQPKARVKAHDIIPRLAHYKVLGLKPGASASEIRKAYHRLVLIYHPDKNHEDPDAVADTFRRVNEAYEVLTFSGGCSEGLVPLHQTQVHSVSPQVLGPALPAPVLTPRTVRVASVAEPSNTPRLYMPAYPSYAGQVVQQMQPQVLRFHSVGHTQTLG
eukprot:s284_g36.t2